MKRTLIILGLAVFCLNPTLRAAEQPVSFSGTYILDVNQSDWTPSLSNMNTIGNLSAGGADAEKGSSGWNGAGPRVRPGEWADKMIYDMNMDMTKPRIGRNDSAIPIDSFQTLRLTKETRLTILQTEGEVQIKNEITLKDGTQVAPTLQNYRLDEKEYPVDNPGNGDQIKQIKKAKMKKNKIVITVKTTLQDPKYGKLKTAIKKEFSLSEDGMILTQIISTDGARPQKQKLIYRKQ